MNGSFGVYILYGVKCGQKIENSANIQCKATRKCLHLFTTFFVNQKIFKQHNFKQVIKTSLAQMCAHAIICQNKCCQNKRKIFTFFISKCQVYVNCIFYSTKIEISMQLLSLKQQRLHLFSIQLLPLKQLVYKLLSVDCCACTARLSPVHELRPPPRPDLANCLDGDS